MTSAIVTAALSDLEQAFLDEFGSIPPFIAKLAAAKAYEIYALMSIIDYIRALHPKFSFQLAHPPATRFRMGGGAFDDSYQHVEVFFDGELVARIVTDVEFQVMSSLHRGDVVGVPAEGYNVHELDVLVIAPDVIDGDYPQRDQVYIGVEAKYRPYQKAFLRELLGYRRELAVWRPGAAPLIFGARAFSGPHATQSDQGNLLMAFCSQANITNYTLPDDDYGIVMQHLPFNP